jgi:hypothetical protein
MMVFSATAGGRRPDLESRHDESHLLERRDGGAAWCWWFDRVAYKGEKIGRSALTRYFLRNASIAAS